MGSSSHPGTSVSDVFRHEAGQYLEQGTKDVYSEYTHPRISPSMSEEEDQAATKKVAK